MTIACSGRSAARPEIILYAQAGPIPSPEAAREFMHAAPFHDYATYGCGRFACVWRPTAEFIGFSGITYVPGIAENELGFTLGRWPTSVQLGGMETTLPTSDSPNS
jgi:hypothetical protein